MGMHYSRPQRAHILIRRRKMKSRQGWKRPFGDPIPLPRGRQLVTLKDAGTYITKLPKAEHTAPEWQAAMQALILVATRGGPTMLARIGVMRALNRHVERVFNPGARIGKALRVDDIASTTPPIPKVNPLSFARFRLTQPGRESGMGFWRWGFC
jgi:hypothetical protein